MRDNLFGLPLAQQTVPEKPQSSQKCENKKKGGIFPGEKNGLVSEIGFPRHSAPPETLKAGHRFDPEIVFHQSINQLSTHPGTHGDAGKSHILIQNTLADKNDPSLSFVSEIHHALQKNKRLKHIGM
ncbi:MAG: hypothetical protein JW885_16505 [Deltaproteobacteria bacterium]|nr:hypothetical protein [Candidatus Zymogenaceae bacterium]